MAKLLDDYRKKQEQNRNQIAEGVFPEESLMAMQELDYRVSVLETLQAFCKSSPRAEDLTKISIHYQTLLAYIRTLMKEHGLGMKADDDMKKKRETAKGNMETIVENGCKQFSSMQQPVAEQYRKSVSNLINTVLPAWLQYRNTYVQL